MELGEITSANTFKRGINKEYCLVYCTISWSVPCQNQYPILVQLAEKYFLWFAIVQVDIDRHPDVVAELTIQSIPTIVVFHNGREVQRLVGLQSLETLQKVLDATLLDRASSGIDGKIETIIQD